MSMPDANGHKYASPAGDALTREILLVAGMLDTSSPAGQAYTSVRRRVARRRPDGEQGEPLNEIEDSVPVPVACR